LKPPKWHVRLLFKDTGRLQGRSAAGVRVLNVVLLMWERLAFLRADGDSAPRAIYCTF
jgi:hypothetical protein